jgi:hypothetical protein
MGSVGLFVAWVLVVHQLPVCVGIEIVRGDREVYRNNAYVSRPPDLRAGKRLMEARRAEMDVPQWRDHRIHAGATGVVVSYWIIVRQFPESTAARAARGRIKALGYREVGHDRLRLELPAREGVR